MDLTLVHNFPSGLRFSDLISFNGTHEVFLKRIKFHEGNHEKKFTTLMIPTVYLRRRTEV